MADEVGEGLLHLDVGPRHLRLHVVLELGDDLLARLAAVRVDDDEVLVGVGRLGVLVHLRPAGAAQEREHLAVRVGRRLLERAQLGVDERRGLVRGVERRPRREGNVHLHRALVERGQEVRPDGGDAPRAVSDHEPRPELDENLAADAEPDQVRPSPFQRPEQQPVRLVVPAARADQQVI